MRAQRQEIKLLEDGGADEDDIIVDRARYRAASVEYAQFSKAMDIPQQRERVTVDGLGNVGVGKYKQDLTEKDYNDIIDMKGKMSDYKVRKWYDYHDKRIGELLDRSQPLEAQAHQAHSLRNQYKFQARELMADQEKRKLLDEKYPLNDFQYYYEKDDDIYKAIIGSSMRPNKKVNRQYGLE